MYILIQPAAAKPWRRNVDTPDEIATAFFEMACVGQTRAHVFGHGATSLHIESLDDLLEVLQTAHALAPHVVNAAELSGMPTFGGADVTVGEGHDIGADEQVLSWDEGRVLLVNDLAAFRIIDRYGVQG